MSTIVPNLVWLSVLFVWTESGDVAPAAEKPPSQEAVASAPTSGEILDLSAAFGKFDGCLVLFDQKREAFARYLPERTAERLSPCSTFKVPNSLIGLETGAIPDADHLIKWDGVKRSRPQLNQDHTLRTAIRDSVVWYYQELARRVGPERMKKWLAKLDYGNQDMSDGLTTFWLGSSLKVSADEQVEFLRRFAGGQLPVSARSQEIVRDILIADRGDGFVLRGKTGSQGEKSPLGWYVGWVERPEGNVFFAANIKGEGANGLRAREIVLRILATRGLLPKDGKG